MLDFSDRAYWAEMRFDEAGRYVVCCTTPGEPNFVSVTPDGFNARTKVHEYGGGAHFVHDGVVYFTNFDDQRMYKQAGAGAKPISLTPEGTGWRFADGHFHEKVGKRSYYHDLIEYYLTILCVIL